MDKLRDRFWIWGHPTNSLYKCFGITEESSMSPVDGMEYLGARNIFYVPMGWQTDRIAETERMKDVREVGWSVEVAARNPENVTEAAMLAKKYPNVTRAVFDDFFNDENVANNYLNYTPELLAKFRQELHSAGAEMWMVLYTKQFDLGLDLKPFIDEFDGISLWFWTAQDVENFDKRLSTFFSLTENKKRLVGCYLYDFGGEKPVKKETVAFQLEKNREFIMNSLTEGVILHTNAVADLGHEGVELAREWLAAHGDENVPELEK